MDDVGVLRDLTAQYADLANQAFNDERRDLWRTHNSLKRTRPLIYVRAFAWKEMPQSELKCQDPLFRQQENMLRQSLFRATFEDDYIFEPWLTVKAACYTPPKGVWGLASPKVYSDENQGSFVWDAPLQTEADFDKLIAPQHIIDEHATAQRVEKLTRTVGDLITINVDRSPVYQVWNGDISTQLAYLRGLEQIMWDMMDRPAWLHKVLAFMRDGILRTHQQAEAVGDWQLGNHQNQAMPYAEEFEDPQANGKSVNRSDLWCFMASQETTAVGPKQFDEFMLQYQLPILKEFGLVAYGCCEDLTRKIDVLRQIPNLRRIAVSPMANVAKCAAQIKQDYVLSYRPSPTDMVGYGFSPQRIHDILIADLEAGGDCHLDITLKDVETVQSDPERVRRWVALTRDVIAEVFPHD